MQRQRAPGDLVTKASMRYVSNVHKPASGNSSVDLEIKRTIKASKIQRDVVSANQENHS